jgi:HEAT repeat protein
VLREQCAHALGEVGDPNAVNDLFLALDRGIAAAAESLGKLCDDAACIKLADRTGRVPFEAMSEALANVVLRTDDRVTSNTKIEVVARVANLRTPQAASLLRGIKAKWPAKGDGAVLHALDAALDTFGGK